MASDLQAPWPAIVGRLGCRIGRTNRGGVAGGEGEGEEVHSRRRRRQQGGKLGDGVADLLRDGLRGVGLERGEEVRLERGLAGGGELRPRGGRGRRRAKPPSRRPRGGRGRRARPGRRRPAAPRKERRHKQKRDRWARFLVGPNVYQAESRHGAWRDSVVPMHVARLSLATSGSLARVCQGGSSVAPKHVA